MSQHAVGGWFYTDGGTLLPDDPTYVLRQADSGLYDHIQASKWCYVLTPRQMGKSSLMARTAHHLRKVEGYTPFIIDLTAFTEQSTMNPESWYLGFANQIARRMDPPFDGLKTWWREHAGLPAVQRLTQFLEDVVLEKAAGNIVIFIDEIDVTLNLTFKDDFFAALRSCFNARAIDPKWKRLTFVLLGVASPAQLISDPTRTPFNIGHRIDLTDFTPEEARPLAAGLNTDPAIAASLLDRVLYWTGGHPFLTQTVCHAAAQSGVERNEACIDSVVRDLFFHQRALHEKDGHIGNASARLQQQKRPALLLYRSFLRGRAIKDEPASPLHIALKLSGIVKADANGNLAIRNRIYRTVFSEKWLREAMPSDWRVTASAALVLVALGLLAYLLPRQQIRTLQIAGEEPVILEAYRSLRRWPWHRTYADALYARYWERQGRRNEALLAWLRAATANYSLENRRGAASLFPDHSGNIALPAERVTTAAFNPDGTILLTGGSDGVARLWRLETRAEIGKPFKHGPPIEEVAFNQHGAQVRTVGGGFFNVRDAVTWEPLYGDKDFFFETTWMSGCAPALHPGSKRFITSHSGKVFLRDARTGGFITELLGDSAAKALAFAADGKHFGVGTPDWFGFYRIEAGFGRHEFSRYLGAPLVPGGLLLSNCPNCFTAALRRPDGTIMVKRFAFDLSDVEPIRGDPKALLAEWERKLNLHFDEAQGRFTPLQ